MKKLIFCTLMTVLCSLPMSAQKRGQRLSPEEMVNRKVEQEQLDKVLTLTDSQEKSVRSLYTDFYSKTIKREERKTKMEELNKSIEALLTDEQKKAFTEWNSKKAQRTGKRN